MRILFIGDIYGRAGRDALRQYLPDLKEKLRVDLVVVNAENAAAGRGPTRKIYQEVLDCGADCITGGDHVWDQKDTVLGMDKCRDLLRPFNAPEGTPGTGIWRKALPGGPEIAVIHLLGRVFMRTGPYGDPFAAADAALRYLPPKTVTFVDLHAEATSEKMAMAHYLDGRVTAVIGSHTHVPTADAQILPGGTAFQADAGMTGDYDSVIGAAKDIAVRRFTRVAPQEHFSPAEGPATLCGVLVAADAATGLATAVAPVRIGGRLQESIPVV